MWKIKQLFVFILFLGIGLSVRSHPVSVMTGDAVWAQNELIINMQMSMDNLMLHLQMPVDEHGYLSKDQLKRGIRNFKKLLESNFEVRKPEVVSPIVTFSTFSKSFPARLKRYELRNYKLEFEIRFKCVNPSSQIALIQTMGDRSRGLQSTSLINFHLSKIPQLVPLYNDLPVKIDLENHNVTNEIIQPVLLIKNKEIEVSLPANWIVHYFPFELLVDGTIISRVPKADPENSSNWPGFIFTLPDDAKGFTIIWKNFTWQMRRVDLVVIKATVEQTVTLSRFRAECSIDL